MCCETNIIHFKCIQTRVIRSRHVLIIELENNALWKLYSAMLYVCRLPRQIYMQCTRIFIFVNLQPTALTIIPKYSKENSNTLVNFYIIIQTY